MVAVVTWCNFLTLWSEKMLSLFLLAPTERGNWGDPWDPHCCDLNLENSEVLWKVTTPLPSRPTGATNFYPGVTVPVGFPFGDRAPKKSWSTKRWNFSPRNSWESLKKVGWVGEKNQPPVQDLEKGGANGNKKTTNSQRMVISYLFCSRSETIWHPEGPKLHCKPLTGNGDLQS